MSSGGATADGSPSQTWRILRLSRGAILTVRASGGRPTGLIGRRTRDGRAGRWLSVVAVATDEDDYHGCRYKDGRPNAEGDPQARIAITLITGCRLG